MHFERLPPSLRPPILRWDEWIDMDLPLPSHALPHSYEMRLFETHGLMKALFTRTVSHTHPPPDFIIHPPDFIGPCAPDLALNILGTMADGIGSKFQGERVDASLDITYRIATAMKAESAEVFNPNSEGYVSHVHTL